MSDIKISHITKHYGQNPVISDVSMHIRAGEFVAVLGPSGCGKTTLLRLVAGFETLDCGTIELGGKAVSADGLHIQPEKRDVGIVFQNYALWPHMSVSENIGYSLKVAGIASAERKRRVDEALATVGLDGFGERRPADLSGGQRQRVALGRCLAAHSSIVLLDEPLANLDVHLRATMEEEFARFHERTGATMLYITHDQAEAMALADRVAVMDKGRIVQIASPGELYREPATEMVASFIGEGFVLPADDVRPDRNGMAAATLFGKQVSVRSPMSGRSRASAKLSFHPRDLQLASGSTPGNAENTISGRATRMVYRGGYIQLDVAPDAAPHARLSLNVAEPSGLNPGDPVSVRIADGWVIPEEAA